MLAVVIVIIMIVVEAHHTMVALASAVLAADIAVLVAILAVQEVVLLLRVCFSTFRWHFLFLFSYRWQCRCREECFYALSISLSSSFSISISVSITASIQYHSRCYFSLTLLIHLQPPCQISRNGKQEVHWTASSHVWPLQYTTPPPSHPHPGHNNIHHTHTAPVDAHWAAEQSEVRQ